MVILEKIRSLRKKKGYSQKYMADKLHISTSGYGKIELGENVLSIERLLDIFKILDVTSYNQILPAINIEAFTEIEKLAMSGGIAFESIHSSSLYGSRIIEDMIKNIKETKQVDNESLVKDLEFIGNILDRNGRDSAKHGYNFISIRKLLDDID